MNNQEIRKIIKDIFRETFPSAGEPEDQTSSADIRSWDSLNHVVLISKVEAHFNIKFELMDMLAMQSFGEICRAVEKKIR